MPLALYCILLAVSAAVPAAAQDWISPDGVDNVRGAGARLRKKLAVPHAAPVPPETAKRTMFNAACGASVDLDKSAGLGAAIPHMNQSWVGNCWAYAGCFGLEYFKRRQQTPAPGNPEVPPCDPVMTSVAVKLSNPRAIPDSLGKDGRREGSFVDSDSFGVFPTALKATTFGRAGQGDLCKPDGCYCARVTDRDIPGPVLLSYYYNAKDIVERHMKKVWDRRHAVTLSALTIKDESPEAVYDDMNKTALLVAGELDSAGLPGIIRSALDDRTLEHLWTLQKLGATFDNKLFAKTILQQSCMPVPVPKGFKLTNGPAGIDDAERAKLLTEPLASAAKMRGLFDWINGRLAGSTPVMIGFCSSLLNFQDPLDPKNGDYVGIKPTDPATKEGASPGSGKGCGNHAVVIVGRKSIGGACYYGVRNSWGEGKLANPELRYNSPPDGTVWVPAYLLIQNTFHAGTYE